jgi:hypothetical protein
VSSLLDIIATQLASGATQQISQQLGTDPSATNQAIAMALPVLLQALAHNASTPKGATDLSNALQRDHNGSLLDDVSGYLASGDNQSVGTAILGHVLGGKRGQVEDGIGQATGLDAAQVGALLNVLAPIVLAQLGKTQRQDQLTPTDLSNVLTQQTTQVQADPGAKLGGLAGMLDLNHDGSIADEAMNIGGQLLNM